jgi:hypothetical protein
MKRLTLSLWLISPFFGFAVGDTFGNSFIHNIKSLLGKNLSPAQIDAYFRLYDYKSVFSFFIAILFWTFATSVILYCEYRKRNKS